MILFRSVSGKVTPIMNTVDANQGKSLVDLAMQCGWQANRVSLYDEEGVEGWEWLSPSGQSYTCIGDWSLPVIEGDDLRYAIQLSLGTAVS
jgi:hypothetical protein